MVRKIVYFSIFITGFIFMVLAGDVLSVSELMQNKEKYDGTEVTVVGKISDVYGKNSGFRNPHFVLRICDNKTSVTVYKNGYCIFRYGDIIIVEGVFQRVKRTRLYTYYDQIDAYTIKKIE